MLKLYFKDLKHIAVKYTQHEICILTILSVHFSSVKCIHIVFKLSLTSAYNNVILVYR
jgi:hypothetical protein